jgi:hypothetical protein
VIALCEMRRMTTSPESLQQKIEHVVERLVREHVAALEVEASAAVREGFRLATRPSASKPRDAESGSSRRSPSRRRRREEMAKLEEQLYQAVCAHPGETMTVLARAVSSTPRELKRPAMMLRASGRLRSVGQRHATRYFPMGT